MLHAVSLHTSAPHSVPSVGGVCVCVCAHVCADMSTSCCSGTWLFWTPLGQAYICVLIREVVLHFVCVTEMGQLVVSSLYTF